MKIKFTSEQKKFITVAELPEVNKIIAYMREDTGLKDYAETAARIASRDNCNEILKAEAEIARKRSKNEQPKPGGYNTGQKGWQTMTQKELKAVYTEELKKVWNDDKMVKHCSKSTAFVIEHNGALYGIEKPKIETSFCFGYGINGIADTEQEQTAETMAETARKSNFEVQSVRTVRS